MPAGNDAESSAESSACFQTCGPGNDADPDAPIPQAPQRTIVHWLIWNVKIANASATIEEGKTPEGATEGQKYGGPCPPQASSAHRYIFTAYAVDGVLQLPAGSTREQLESALADHTLAKTTHGHNAVTVTHDSRDSCVS